MRKILKQVFLIVSITLVLTLPYFVFAQNAVMNDFQKAGEASGFSANTDEYSLAKTIGMIIQGFLSLLGIIFISLMINAGFNWMYAGGDTGKIDNAKNTIRRAIIGLIIIVSSYALWYFIYLNFV